MSVARHSRQTPARVAPAPADMSALRQRRLLARRRRRLARVDVGVGVAAGLMLLIISPGLAVSGLIALLVLAACAGSLFAQRRMRRRATDPRRARPRVDGKVRRRA
jgi:hypothetical protein